MTINVKTDETLKLISLHNISSSFALLLFHWRDVCLSLFLIYVPFRDVKPHNVLICPPDSSKPWGVGVLTDLGSVTASRQSVETRQQGLQAEEEAALKSSAPYRAPELTSVRPPVQICEKVDVWSLGCTMFSLAFGRSPFEVNNAVQRLGILNARYQYPHNNSMRECKYSDQYVQLINSMLELDPLTRYPPSFTLFAT